MLNKQYFPSGQVKRILPVARGATVQGNYTEVCGVSNIVHYIYYVWPGTQLGQTSLSHKPCFWWPNGECLAGVW